MQTVSVLTNQRASGGVASLITPSSGARPSSLFNYAGKLVFLMFVSVAIIVFGLRVNLSSVCMLYIFL